MTQLDLSVCAYYCILKLVRAIANLVRGGETQPVHLAEALQYRPKLTLGEEHHDRESWSSTKVLQIYRGCGETQIGLRGPRPILRRSNCLSPGPFHRRQSTGW